MNWKHLFKIPSILAIYLLSISSFAQNMNGITVSFSEGTHSFCFGDSSDAFNVTIMENVANKGAFGNTSNISTTTLDSIVVLAPDGFIFKNKGTATAVGAHAGGGAENVVDDPTILITEPTGAVL